MVSDAGYVPDMKIERIDKIPAEKEVAAKLHIEEGDLVLISERLVTAEWTAGNLLYGLYCGGQCQRGL